MQDVTVENLMSSPAQTIHANERFDKALHLFQTKRISILPVINTNGCCVGVITLKDIIDKQNELIAHCRRSGYPVDDQPVESDAAQPLAFFGDIEVYEAMSDPFISVTKDCLMTTCLDILLEQHIHHLPVLDAGQRLLGVVSAIDLLNYVRPNLCASENCSSAS